MNVLCAGSGAPGGRGERRGGNRFVSGGKHFEISQKNSDIAPKNSQIAKNFEIAQKLKLREPFALCWQVRALLVAGGNVEGTHALSKRTPLHYAAKSGHTEVTPQP